MNWYIGYVVADPKRMPRKGPWGWRAIRWFQGWPHYEHGAKVHVFPIFDLDKGLTVTETSNTVYRTSSLAQRSSGTPLDILKAPSDGANAWKRAELMAGDKVPYGWTQIAGHGPKLLADKALNLPRKWLGKDFVPSAPSKNPWLLKGSGYCTETTLDLMQLTGLTTPWLDRHAGVLCHVLYPWMIANGYKLVKQTSGERIVSL